jgi:hypothetical protein
LIGTFVNEEEHTWKGRSSSDGLATKEEPHKERHFFEQHFTETISGCSFSSAPQSRFVAHYLTQYPHLLVE